MTKEEIATMIAGALFDFGGFLTTRAEAVTVGAAHDAAPVVQLVAAFLESRGLDPAGAADVEHWQDRLC